MVNAQQAMLLLIPALPLLAGALLCANWRRVSPGLAGWTGAGSLAISGLLALRLWPTGATISLPWITLPDALSTAGRGQLSGMDIPLALSAGAAQLTFGASCAWVAALVVIYALRERQGDPAAARLLAQLTLFAGTMLLFVQADTTLILYAAWEAMGLLSYYLIAHHGTAGARRAASQAFWTTRATDFGLLFALLLLLTRFGWATLSSIDLHRLILAVQEQGGETSGIFGILKLASFLVLLAVVGKAAQWPLSFWLSGAMVAPTPVSALLHAATMVAAGPFLLCQLHQLFLGTGEALAACVYVGSSTLVLCGLMACAARDAKQVLAYSTASQLGLAILGVGALAEEATVIQLTAHAWIKAALFLWAGYLASITPGHPTALSGLAGVLRGRTVQLSLFVLAALALAGLPFTGGALGKESIILALMTRAGASPDGTTLLAKAMPAAAGAWAFGALAGKLGLLITAAYLARLIFLLTRKPDQSSSAEPEPQPASAGWQAALAAAAALSLVGAIALSFALPAVRDALTDKGTQWKWQFGDPGRQFLPLSALAIGAGVLCAWLALRRRASRRGVLAWVAGYFADGMRLEQFWRSLVGAPAWVAAVWAARNDRQVIDGLVVGTGRFGRWLAGCSRWVDEHIVDGLRYWGCEVWWVLRRGHQRFLQTGYIQHYMFVVLLGAVVLCFVILRPLADIFGKIMGAI